MFLAISFIVTQNWKTPKGSLTSEQVTMIERHTTRQGEWY